MRVALAALALLALTLAPAAQAQGTMQTLFTLKTPQMEPGGVALRPGLDAADLRVPWVYAANTAGESLLFSGQTVVLHWSLDPATCSRPGVLLLGPMEEAIQIPTPWLQGSIDGVSHFEVRVTNEAPGETVIQCQLRGMVTSAGPFPTMSPSSAAFFTVVAAYQGRINVERAASIVSAPAGGASDLALSVENLGNADTLVDVKLATPLPDGWKASLPADKVLASRLAGNSSTLAKFTTTVYAPSGFTGEKAIALLVDAHSTRDTSKGTSTTVVYLVRLGGVAANGANAAVHDASVQSDLTSAAKGKVAPGASPLFAVALLGVAAVARRRAR